jgi:transmembrane sensor
LANRGNTASRLEDEAAAWAARIDAAPASSHPDLDQWLCAHPAHRGALLRAQATLVMLGGDVPAVPGTEKIEPPRFARKWRVPALAAGGAVAASLAAAALLLPVGERIRTDLGEVRSVALHDGSSLAVDARTTLRANIGIASRDVTLEDGKALFRVRHDPAIPFRVRVGDVTITDIGTVFQVSADRDAGIVDVLVSQGAIEVRRGATTTRLAAGQRARFATDANAAAAPAAIEPVDAAAIERALGWTDGRLELDGETLGEAVAELNRHNRLQITLVGPRLAGEKLYGSFRMDDPAGFARTAALGIGASAQIEARAIVIAPAKKR